MICGSPLSTFVNCSCCMLHCMKESTFYNLIAIAEILSRHSIDACDRNYFDGMLDTNVVVTNKWFLVQILRENNQSFLEILKVAVGASLEFPVEVQFVASRTSN